jgi:hypothetical protein
VHVYAFGWMLWLRLRLRFSRTLQGGPHFLFLLLFFFDMDHTFYWSVSFMYHYFLKLAGCVSYQQIWLCITKFYRKPKFMGWASLDFYLNIKASFGSRNKSLEWNDFLLFGRGLFLGIGIPIGIPIPLRRGIPIPLKNERNSYSLG